MQTVDLGGGVETSVGMTDAFLLALSADDGSYRASSSFGTAGDDYAVGVVGDAEGNVTIGGTFATGTLALGGGHVLMGTAGGNAFLASFGSDGGHRWSHTIAGGGGTGVSNQIHSLAIDREGNVTAGGEFWGFAEFGGAVPNPTLVTGDAFVASYDASGSPRWGRTFGSPGTERTLGVAANPAGDIVAGGSFDGTVDFGGTTLTSTGFGLGDGWLAILDGGDGDTRLARAIDGELTTAVRDVAAGADASASIAADVQGALDLGAGPVPPRGRITLARLDPTTGAPRFAARYGGGPSDAAWSVAVGRHGATAAAGMASRNADLGLGPIVGAQAQYGFVMMLAP